MAVSLKRVALILSLITAILPTRAFHDLTTSGLDGRRSLHVHNDDLLWQSGRALVEMGRTEAGDFSWSKLITVGIKVMLAVLSSEDNLSKSDTISKQAVLGTVLSAVTGVEDPSEISVMAKQATQVIGLLQTLVEAVKMSVLSS